MSNHIRSRGGKRADPNRALNSFSEGAPTRYASPVTVVPEHPARWIRLLWLLAAAILIPLVFFIQQFTLGLRGQTLAHVPQEVAARETPDEPGISEFTLAAKAMVKMARLSPGHDRDAQEDPDAPPPKQLD